MPILADCHMHSSFSGDSVTPMEELVQRGMQIGLKQMCFTEHLDLDFPVSQKHPKDTFTIPMSDYWAEFSHCREKYRGQIELLMGVEMGLQPHVIRENQNFLDTYSFDFVIGSCHVCGGLDPCEPSFHQGKTQREVCQTYFSSIMENIRTFGDYDVFGHLDYVLRYFPGKDSGFSFSDYWEQYDEILRALLERGKGIEVNTGGLMKGLREPHPCMEALRRYRVLGGELLTVGSDAHTAENVGARFAQVREILLACGYRYYTVFRERVPQWYAL